MNFPSRAWLVLLCSAGLLLTGCGGSSSSGTSPNPSSTTPYTASINSTQTNQTIVGFGGAEAFYQSDLAYNPNSSQIYTALFDPQQGLGITILRLQDVYSYQGANGNPASPSCTDPVSQASIPNCFDPATEAIASEASHIVGSSLQVLMSSWSPPANLKSTNNVVGGTLAGGPSAYNYTGFGQYWHDSIPAYRALNINPTWISIQNEPNYVPTYVGCGFDATEDATNAGYPQALNAVYTAVQTLTNPPILVGPEIDGLDNIASYLSAMNLSEVGAIAHHLYNGGDGNNPATFSTEMAPLNTYSLPRFETEYYNNSTTTGTDNYGFDAGWTIHTALTQENASMYLYWSLAWPDQQQGLLYADGTSWKYLDQYYAMKHFSFFIRPGYKRVTAAASSSSLPISAYLSPDGKTLVAVLLNPSTSSTAQVTLSFSGFTPSTSTIYRSTFLNSTERWANAGAMSGDVVSLPPQAIATVVMQ